MVNRTRDVKLLSIDEGTLENSQRTRIPIVNTTRTVASSLGGVHATALEAAGLKRLMDVSSGRPEVTIGLIDGPVDLTHPDLALERIRELSATGRSIRSIDCTSVACAHGTFIAGILSARRTSMAPAICPGCTLLIRPIFTEVGSATQMPSTSPNELAAAILDTIEAGAKILNLSCALVGSASKGETELVEALDRAVARGVLVVAAAGNQGTITSSAITRHPWVIPVSACDARRQPVASSNLGNSIGRRGLSAPGDAITSLSADRNLLTSGGTSAAAAFVTGSIALLLSEFPSASVAQIKVALTETAVRRRSIAPPLLDAWRGYEVLAAMH